MPSTALNAWQTTRAKRLDRLRAAHAAVGGIGPGRRWLTEEINHSLIVRLAAEFQGFARELHDEAVAAVVLSLAPSNPQLRLALTITFTSRRKIDQGNADPGCLGNDFALLGMNFWQALANRYPQKKKKWNTSLTSLNDARNGVAHGDGQKIAKVEAECGRLNLSLATKWRSSLDGLAVAMDHVVEDHVYRLYGQRPW